MGSPVVSVLMVTYAHEDFIDQALESVFAQETDFAVEVLVSEDLSPDSTRERVLAWQRRYPDRVRVFLSERNQNDNEVMHRAWREARGKYIAVLDGDDYWTDNRKLQKQVDFLERNPDVFICGHAVSVVDRNGVVIQESKFDIYEDRFLSDADLAWGYPLPVLSVLFRNNGMLPPQEIFNSVFNADTFMYAFFANFGGGYVSREVMGAYRAHSGGVWSGIDPASAIDHRNRTLSTIPSILSPRLRAIGYGSFLRHSLSEDRRLGRRMRNIPYALAMALLTLRPSSFHYFARRLLKRASRR